MRYFLLIMVFAGLVVGGLNVVAQEQSQAAPELPGQVIGWERAEGGIFVNLFGYSWHFLPLETFFEKWRVECEE